MLFNSFSYVIFLPIVFILYWMLPHKYRKYLLLITSYYFYMSWNVKYVVLILFTTVVSYVAAILLEKTETVKKKRRIAATAVLACLSLLLFFKYLKFVLKNIVIMAQAVSIPIHVVTLNFLLPVGISFYTFQTLSYVVDVYKNKVPAEHNFVVYATFVSFFPQLVAGPIERAGNLLPQIKSKHKFDEEKAIYGTKLMWGGTLKSWLLQTQWPYTWIRYMQIYHPFMVLI